MYNKNRILVILQTENKKVLMDVVERYDLIPAGHTDMLSRDPINIWDYNQFILDLDFIPNISDFVDELKELGFNPKFADVDTHVEVIF